MNIVVAMVTIRLVHDRIRIKKREYSCYFGSDIRIDLPIYREEKIIAEQNFPTCSYDHFIRPMLSDTLTDWKGLEKGSRSNGILFMK